MAKESVGDVLLEAIISMGLTFLQALLTVMFDFFLRIDAD